MLGLASSGFFWLAPPDCQAGPLAGPPLSGFSGPPGGRSRLCLAKVTSGWAGSSPPPMTFLVCHSELWPTVWGATAHLPGGAWPQVAASPRPAP